MSAKTILVVLFLISLGVVVLLGLRALPERSSTDVTADEVLVAAVALPQGTLLRAKDVIWRQVLSAAKSDHIVHSATEAGTSIPSEISKCAPKCTVRRCVMVS